jgi:hypothetical protein
MKAWVSAFALLLAVSSVQRLVAWDDCSRIAASAIYSNAFASRERETFRVRVGGRTHDDSIVEVLYYIYKGAPSSEAIPLPGRLPGGTISIKGDWVEHLIESPSGRETVQTHHV